MASTKKRIRQGQLNTLVEPNYVSVVETPANRTGFKVIREDKGTMSLLPGKQKVHSKRKDSQLLSIDLPEGVSRSSAEEIMHTYALEEEYEIVERDGHFSLVRSGAEERALDGATLIPLGDGVMARIERKDEKKQTTPGVQLVRLDFSGDGFSTVDSVKGWLIENEIDFADGGVEKTDNGFSVTRVDAVDGAKGINIFEGVVAMVVRSEETDVPQKVYRNVVDAAYGNWGWGHIDFAASLADPCFTEHSWDALYALRDVLENIVIYSGLPMGERKRLIRGACEQYANYMDLVIDALPTTVLEQSRSGAETLKREDSVMSKVNEKPADDVSDESKDAGDNQEQMISLSREDLDGLAKTTAETVVAGVIEAQKRSDDSDDASDEKDGEGEPAEIAALTKVVGDLANSVKTMRSDMDELTETTDTRREDDESQETSEAQPKSVFGGILG